MFRKINLNTNEKEELLKIQKKLLIALLQRSDNPSKFEQNINFLKEHAECSLALKKFINPHLEGVRVAQERILIDPWNLFNYLCLEKLRFKNRHIKKEASQILYPKPVLDLTEFHSQTEPRIKSFITSENHSLKDNLSFEINVAQKGIILFADDSVLTINSLSDEKELIVAKELFNQKMKGLEFLVDIQETRKQFGR